MEIGKALKKLNFVVLKPNRERCNAFFKEKTKKQSKQRQVSKNPCSLRLSVQTWNSSPERFLFNLVSIKILSAASNSRISWPGMYSLCIN